MSEGFSVGSEIVMPGFRGRVVAILDDQIGVVDGELDGAMEPHAAEADELAILLSGRVRVTMDGEERVCVPGDYVVVPKGTLHGVVADVPSRLFLIGRLG